MNRKITITLVLTAIILTLSLAPITYAASVDPSPYTGSIGNCETECGAVDGGDFCYKIDGWKGKGKADGTYGDAITISNSDGKTFDWSCTYSVVAVIVKGGTGANVFEYDGETFSDTNLYAPLNLHTPDPDDTYDISHVTFCMDIEAPKGKIRVEKRIDWGYQSQYQNDWTFRFKADWTKGVFELKDGESMEWELEEGDYEVSEKVSGGWVLFEILVEGTDDYEIDGASVEVKLEKGDDITITFENRPPDFVIPENPLGTLGSALSFFAVLALLYALKRGNLSIVLE